MLMNPVYVHVCVRVLFVFEPAVCVQSVLEGSVTAKTIAETAARSENPIKVLQALLIKVIGDNERLKADLKVLGTELARGD